MFMLVRFSLRGVLFVAGLAKNFSFNASLRFSDSSASSFGGFFIVSVLFHVFYESFFFAKFFESSNHLLDGFARP